LSITPARRGTSRPRSKAYCKRPNHAPTAPGGRQAITWPHPTNSCRAFQRNKTRKETPLVSPSERSKLLLYSCSVPLRTSYALQCGYEGLIRGVGLVSARDIENLRERLTMAGDARDVLCARDSVMRILGVEPLKG
jgi:hypothetical protein